jgi:hypothetical protein
VVAIATPRSHSCRRTVAELIPVVLPEKSPV